MRFDCRQKAVPATWGSAIRTVEQMDTAVRYTKTSKGPVHVYWIRGRQTNSHYLYFVIDGSPLVYAASGELRSPLETYPDSRGFGKIPYQPSPYEYNDDETSDQPVCRT